MTTFQRDFPVFSTGTNSIIYLFYPHEHEHVPREIENDFFGGGGEGGKRGMGFVQVENTWLKFTYTADYTTYF